MKHKRQTLSKDDPEIKDSKSKSESSLNEDKTQSCQSRDLPVGGLHPVKEEEGEGGGGVKKEDLSDHENSESVSSIPDSEEGGGGERVSEMLEQGGEAGGGGGDPSSRGSRLTGRGIHSPLSSPSGGGIPLVPPGHPRNREVGGPAGGLPVTATVGKNKLTSLPNLSPTPKSLLTGSQLLLLKPFCFNQDQTRKTSQLSEITGHALLNNYPLSFLSFFLSSN